MSGSKRKYRTGPEARRPARPLLQARRTAKNTEKRSGALPQGGGNIASFLWDSSQLHVVGGHGGQIAQVVALVPIRQRAQVFAAVPAGNGHTPDTALLCQGHALVLGKHPAVGKLISGNLSVFSYEAGNALGVLVWHGIHDVDVSRQIADPAVVFLTHCGFLPFRARCRRACAGAQDFLKLHRIVWFSRAAFIRQKAGKTKFCENLGCVLFLFSGKLWIAFFREMSYNFLNMSRFMIK